MPWSKLDDGLHENAKIAAMSDKAFRLYICGITYSARHRLRGRLSFGQVAVLFRLTGAKQKQADELVSIRAWEAAEDGYAIHNYDEYQANQEEISQKRAAAGRVGGQRSGAIRGENAKQRSKNEAIASSDAKQTRSKGTPTPNPTPDPIPIPEPEPIPKAKKQRGANAPRFAPPTPDEAEDEFVRHGFGGQRLGSKFVTHYARVGWRFPGGLYMTDWRSAIESWVQREIDKGSVASVLSTNGTHTQVGSSSYSDHLVELGILEPG